MAMLMMSVNCLADLDKQQDFKGVEKNYEENYQRLRQDKSMHPSSRKLMEQNHLEMESFFAIFQEGDELWSYSPGKEDVDEWGYAIVRKGKRVAKVMTRIT